jgi:MinD-like ATPase involved in chromosome partitioning or flagellar assembly
MEQRWRTSLKQYIEEHYVQGQDEWYEIVISPSGLLNIVIVSHHFADQSFPERREHVEQFLQINLVPLSTGYLSLYTPQESEKLELKKPLDDAKSANTIYSWFDLAVHAANATEMATKPRREPRIPSTIVFYSFKGGVGRTTALTHVAVILAKRGRKVVAVDLDIEAPGLSSALEIIQPSYGIVDYFYERSYIPKDVAPEISIAEIFSEVSLINVPGRLFIVPAGNLDLNYLSKIDDLRANITNERGEDLWSTFYREITEQLQPDVILVDSRTGLNEWGAFSLLRAADKAIVFLYPNEQNRQGIHLLTDTLVDILPTYFVFSPVPAMSDLGMEMVKRQWESLQIRDMNAHVTTYSDDENEILNSEIDPAMRNTTDLTDDNPIVVPYLTSVALADTYPVEQLLSYYTRIANMIDEDTSEIRLESILTSTADRRKIIESLNFPEVDSTRNPNLGDLFQRTSDFERFLDPTTCLIRGRKGTGKTALYRLPLKHAEEARRLSRKRLDAVTCLSGHGEFRQRPEKDDFLLIGREIAQARSSWEAFWRAYLFLRMQQEDILSRFIKGNSKFQPIRAALNKVQRGVDEWKIEYTQLLVQMVRDVELDLLLKDALVVINNQLLKNPKQGIFWFLYDDLDVDFREENELRNEALTGLFQLVQACDARQLKTISFKIFLREDIWRRLIFDNKSHFNGRDISLRWTRRDFLRLALRQAQQSKEFRDLVERFSPVEDVDQADESTIDHALQLLWGNRRERNPKSKHVSSWVYERLTDSSGTTFPRSLTILLKAAKEYELAASQELAYPDRLLRMSALVDGLKQASEHRCDELRNEYSELGPFFGALVGLNILIAKEELHKAWQRTVENRLPEFKDFNKFIDFLVDIGLLRFAERGKEQGYRFAEIYTHGFHIYRGTRKY